MHQKGIAYIVLILTTLLLLVGVGIAVYLTQFTQIFKPKASENRLCTANSVDSLRACIADINSNLTEVIEITNTIICDQQSVCEFKLDNINRPVTIRGAPNSGAGFRRTQNYNYN